MAAAVIGMEYLVWSKGIVIVLGLMAWGGKLVFCSDDNKAWGKLAVSFYFRKALESLQEADGELFAPSEVG